MLDEHNDTNPTSHPSPHHALIPLMGLLLLSSILLGRVLIHRDQLVAKMIPQQRQLTPAPDIKALAYDVRIFGEDKPLLAQREWKRMAPASLTKLLTTVLAQEQLDTEQWIPISEDAKKIHDNGEKLSPAPAGELFLRDDMIHLALIESYNDAAAALAEEVGKEAGGVTFSDRMEKFVALVNAKAGAIGMNNSHFENATGIDSAQHYVTAEDLSRLVEYIWENHAGLWEVTRTIEKVVYSESKKPYTLDNTDDLLKEFPGILGSKTGFTDNAQGALVLLYPLVENRVASIIILGSSDRFGDGRAIIKWLEQNF